MHHTKSLGTGTKSGDGRNSLSHLLAEGKEKGNKSAITDNLFLKVLFIPYPLSQTDLRSPFVCRGKQLTVLIIQLTWV